MKPERVFADTNLFLRCLANDVPEQADAVERVLQMAAEVQRFVCRIHVMPPLPLCGRGGAGVRAYLRSVLAPAMLE